MAKLTDQARQDLCLKFYNAMKDNPLVWGETYLPEYFREEFTTFHLKLVLEMMKHQHFAVAAPRGSSKSTLLSFLRPMHAIYFKKKRFILMVQNTFTKAAQALDNIKTEFKTNKKITDELLMTVRRDAFGDTIFHHIDGFETRVLCKGVEQIGSVRGERFGAYRPDLIIGDDIEDDEMVENPEQRMKVRKLFDEALIPAGDTHTEVNVVGTILHDDALMAKLVSLKEYPEYRKLKYRALLRKPGNNHYYSLWPAKWSVDWLLNLQKTKPEVFAKEYQNDPVIGELRKFHRRDFRKWERKGREYILYGSNNEVIGRGNLSDCKAAISCDLAWEHKKRHDETVIMPGFFTPESEILIDSYVHKRGMRPHEIEEILFDMDDRYQKLTGSRVKIGFEKAKLEKVVKFLLKEAMRKRNKFLMFKDLLWDGDKNHRIEVRLSGRYNQHVIFHRSGMGDLENQLLRFPSAAHDDILDCAQGLVQLFSSAKKRTSTQQEDPFMRLRQFAIDAKNPSRKPYIFGQPRQRNEIPSTTSPL